MRKYLSEIFHILDNDSKKLPFIFLLILFTSLIDLIGLGLMGPYVSMVLNPDSFTSISGILENYLNISLNQNNILILLGLILLSVFSVKTFFAIVINKVIIRFSQNQQLRLRSSLMQSYQLLPYIEYLKRNSSEYIYNIHELTKQYSMGVIMPLLKTFSDLIIGLAIVLFLAWHNILALAILISILAIVLFFYDFFFKKNTNHYGVESNKESKNMLQGIQEGVDGFKEIRILGSETYFHNTMYVAAKKYASYIAKLQIISIMPRYLLELSMILFIVSLISFTLLIGDDIQSLFSTLAIFGVAALRIIPSLNSLSTSLVQLRYNRNAVSLLFQDYKKFKVGPQNSLIKKQSSQNERLNLDNVDFSNFSLKNVSFSYSDEKRKALTEISLKIFAGESVGLMGQSGSGKTTLIDVILGLLNPQSGEIKYNNRPLKEYIDQWHAQVAYLPQEIFLIDDTLKSNIALGIEVNNIDQVKLDDAIKKAKLDDLVENLPNKADTVIGERGMRLSGGQRQRIAIARAFYHGRNVLIMDESTSALDSETEKEIIDEIKFLKKDKTLIVIAHRLSTLKDCDRIYELKDGEIINSGTYKELVK
jgi:ATP-binding cassette, subfamily B, bacterial PglK